MASDRQIRIRIQRRGQSTPSPVDMAFGTVLIGSGSHCDVRLLPDEAAERQLAIEPSGKSLRIRSLAREPRFTYQALGFDELVIDDEVRLECGELVLTIELRTLAGVSEDSRAGLLRTIRQTVLLAGLAVGFYFALQPPPSHSSLRRSVTPPALFAEKTQVRCPQQDRSAALALAEEQLVLAESKRERSPFRLHDGVLAVPLYEVAAACFAQAEVAGWSDEAAAAGSQLKQELANTLHTHQVRLDWFLGRKKLEAARTEVLLLRELMRGRSDAYSQWLAAVERELGTVLAAQKKNKRES